MSYSDTQGPALLRGFARLNYRVCKYARNLAGALLAVMVIMILAQVFFRYVLNDSLAWTEEMAKYLMVWVACLVAPWAYRENLNVSIEMFVDAMPRLFRLFSEMIITALVIAICAVFFVESVYFWQGGQSMVASSIPIQLSYFYACAPFAFGMTFLVGLERFGWQWVDLMTGSDPEQESTDDVS